MPNFSGTTESDPITVNNPNTDRHHMIAYITSSGISAFSLSNDWSQVIDRSNDAATLNIKGNYTFTQSGAAPWYEMDIVLILN